MSDNYPFPGVLVLFWTDIRIRCKNLAVRVKVVVGTLFNDTVSKATSRIFITGD